MRQQLDHEKLDVYQVELRFVAWASDLMDELAECAAPKSRRAAEALDHLDRAALSILFNTAEGNGRRQMKQRARFFDDARGSATECSACLDALVAKRLCTGERILAGKEMLVRVVAMLSKLVDRFDQAQPVREDTAEYDAGVEDEDDDESDDESDGGRWPHRGGSG